MRSAATANQTHKCRRVRLAAGVTRRPVLLNLSPPMAWTIPKLCHLCEGEGEGGRKGGRKGGREEGREIKFGAEGGHTSQRTSWRFDSRGSERPQQDDGGGGDC
jgi:hypothetical protein